LRYTALEKWWYYGVCGFHVDPHCVGPLIEKVRISISLQMSLGHSGERCY
jgi:hypothetical protein